jgi:hypothetical protein
MMHERTSSPTGRLLRIASVLLLASLGVAYACGGDDDYTSERPEPPPATRIDAGLETGPDGEISGCPSSPPRVGEVCPRPEQVEETCHYELGTCVVEGTQYDRVADYRCNNGIWIRWGEPGPCDMP